MLQQISLVYEMHQKRNVGYAAFIQSGGAICSINMSTSRHLCVVEHHFPKWLLATFDCYIHLQRQLKSLPDSHCFNNNGEAARTIKYCTKINIRCNKIKWCRHVNSYSTPALARQSCRQTTKLPS